MSIEATREPRSSLYVNYNGNGQYQVNQTAERRTRPMNRSDVDGDGVVDGEALAGESGRVVNEGAVNQLLAMRGLQVRNGVISALDGAAGGQSIAALTEFRGTPPLPRPAARAMGAGGTPGTPSAEQMLGHARALELRDGMADGALMWNALNTMAVSSMREMKDARDVRQAMQRGKIEAKKNEINSTQAQIEAERDAARTAFMWSVVGSVATLALSMTSGQTGIGDAAANAIGSTAKSFGDMMSKTSGAQQRADQERLAAMRHQMTQEVFEQNVDGAKASYDEAREQFRLAVKIITEFYERQTQSTNAMTRA